MELSGFENRNVTYRAPFSVKEIDDEKCTYIDGRHVGFNIVDKNGLGVAHFGIDRIGAQWFCDAANEKAKLLLHK